MMRKMTEVKYEPDPRLAKALDVLFILHADHEQNCSTAAVRAVGSSQVDPYSAVAAGVAALYGPLHGGANEAVLRMLRRIEKVENIPDFLEGVKNRDEKLMGFGHRVYKNYDPRARIIKKHVDEVLEMTGDNPLLEIATELEKHALDDEYFTSRKLYPNVDFYSGLIYEAIGIPSDMFTVIFAIPRTSGWIAQWMEMNGDDEQKIARPRQIYTGERDRSYVDIADREGPEKITGPPARRPVKARRGAIEITPAEILRCASGSAGSRGVTQAQSVTPINVGSGISVTPKAERTPSRSSRASARSSAVVPSPRLTSASVCLVEIPTEPLP